MKLKHTLFILLLAAKSYAQVGINATGAAPDAKAMLDISSTTKGFLWPRMTLAQRNAISTAPGVTPEGLTVFDTDTKNLWIWKNGVWAPYLQSPWDINGTDIFNMNTGNVGIGIATPQAKLHVSGTTSTTILNEITGPGNAALELKTSAALYDFLELRKWSTGGGGYFGSVVTPTSIPLTGLSTITTGTFTTGGLLVGTKNNNPLYFATNLTEKMRITADGMVGIGTTIPTQKLDIDGQIRIRGGGPALGKVLTSTNDGTGSWEYMGIPNHNHFSETWTGSASNAGLIINNSDNVNSAAALVASMSGGGTAQNTGIVGTTNSPLGRGIMGINSSGTSTGLPGINAGVSGTAGTGPGVHGNSVSGASIYGEKTATLGTGNAGLFRRLGGTTTDATVLITNNDESQNALELRNGYLKVSGTTSKTAFIITAGSGGSTISGNRVRFSYPGMSSTDILIVNHQYVGAYIGAVGNWYETSMLAPVNQWTIFREDNLAMPIGEKFTVLVIKQ